jgi:hypothetical protein
MKARKTRQNLLSAVIAFALAIVSMAGFPALKVYGASGTVYSCVINRCYAHPVTGVIEDSGGESSYATGQGMVEGCVYNSGILEVTDEGAYYLTIRLSLMDYTSGHSFLVQNVGDSGWSSPSEMGVTGNGTDSNGTTADVCMRVPSENCVVRGSMYVEPMGRDVIFYLYPSDYSEGNGTDMNATMVTESSGSSGDNSTAEEGNSASNPGASGSADSGSAGSGNSSTQGSGSSDSQNSGSLGQSSSGSSSGTTGNGSGTASSSTDSSKSTARKLQSSITEAATPDSEATPDTQSSTLDAAEGLSLSTAQDLEEDGSSQASDSQNSGSSAIQVALVVLIVGLILLAAVVGVIYFVRKNWKRWGGAPDDED